MINFEHPAIVMRKYFVNKYGINEMINIEKQYLMAIDRLPNKILYSSGFVLWQNAYNRQCQIAVSIIVDYEERHQRKRNSECDT